MNLRNGNGIMVLATMFVGHGHHAYGSPLEALFRQDGTARETWDDVAIVKDDSVGVSLIVE